MDIENDVVVMFRLWTRFLIKPPSRPLQIEYSVYQCLS